jgi:hypothetical protein
MVACGGIRFVLLALSLGTLTASALDISAFNIQVFGVSKMGKPHVVEKLVQIINRYDLVLIQEIRDATFTAIYELLDECNAATSDTWAMELSDRLGRTSSKEQYAYFYRASKYSVVDTYQVPEDRAGADRFERPPFVVRFRAAGTSVGEFGYMGIHVKPDDAVREIDYLADVYDDMVSRWGLTDIIIGGDLNAGCSYVRPGDWDSIRLRTQSRFRWVIGDDADTTIATSQCPYDRFVLAGSRLQNAYQSNSAIPFRFDVEYGMTQAEAGEVSDHVPVEMVVN